MPSPSPRFTVHFQRAFNQPVEAETALGRTVVLTGPNLHHLKNVLRLSIGSEVIISDTQTHLALRARIRSLSSEGAELLIEGIETSPSLPPLHLILGMVKPRTADFIVEKCVELGVRTITFFAGMRSQGGEQQRAYERLDRFLRIAESAAKQSGGGPLPKINRAAALPELLAKLHHERSAVDEARYLCSLHGELNALPLTTPHSDTTLLIGPEGGFTTEEEECALSFGYQRLLLSPRTLRVETAVVVGCALILRGR